jgi:hypothetical protein
MHSARRVVEMQDKSLQDVWYNRQNASPFLTGEGCCSRCSSERAMEKRAGMRCNAGLVLLQ